MNKLKTIVKISFILFLTQLAFVSCSGDDEAIAPAPERQPSRTIAKVDIYKSTDKTELLTYLIFTYDSQNRLIRINNKKPVGIVNYVYGDKGAMSYSYASVDVPLVEVSTTLEDGRAYICNFTDQKNAIAYSYENGYLKASNSNNNIGLQYTWKEGNLASIVATGDSKYSSTFTASYIANDYSIDLNTLPQLVSSLPDYTTIMNTYGQMAGILGHKSKNFVSQDMYEDSYDREGRLKLITIYTSNAEGYTFRIHYEDNVLEE